jgi:hypothetical protein
MQWPPYFVLDLNERDVLPPDWAEQVRAATEAPERLVVQSGAEIAQGDEMFSILGGADVRARFGWLWDLYHREFREFVSQSFERPAFAANRISSSITLNILEGAGAGHDWHTDSNQVTGVFYANTLEQGDGGELEFRHPDHETASLRPRAGTFICFPGAISHRVLPLRESGLRLSFTTLYYDSAEDQPFANLDDRYELSPA